VKKSYRKSARRREEDAERKAEIKERSLWECQSILTTMDQGVCEENNELRKEIL